MPVRQNKEKIHHSRFHSDSQYRLLLFHWFWSQTPHYHRNHLCPYTAHLDYRKIMILLNFLIILFSHSSIRLWSFATSTFPIMQLICFPPPPQPPFLLGITAVQREIENNAYAKFWAANKVHYGKCESGVGLFLWLLVWSSWLSQWREDLTSWLPPSSHKLCLSSIIRLGLEDNKTFLSDARQPKVVFFHFWTVILPKF